jgi:hypothetical protein
MMRKLCERILYTGSLIVLLVVAAIGLSSTLGISINTALADDFELEGRVCTATAPQGCSYYGCTSNCDSSGCHPRCIGTGSTCGEPACQ